MHRQSSRKDTSTGGNVMSESEREEGTLSIEKVSSVQTLVAGRQKRSTAGNRLAHLLDKEADKDDDLELLFEEPEDDFEFEIEGDAALSDVHLSSSEDGDEEGGRREASSDGQPKEDLSGEVELQLELRAERKARKRKMQESFLKPQKASQQKKKVQILEKEDTADPPTPTETSALTRVRKKSERISWIPTDGPVRSSSRKQTLQNRELTHQRLIESERRRRETIALMEKAAAKKAKENPKKAMTQAERLEEAKKTEELNKKSLNKWEEAEAQRAEQQRAKLAALQSRQMEGPFIRFWSGRAEWDQKGRLGKIGRLLVEEIEEKKSKEKEKKPRGRPAKLPLDTEQSAGSTTITQTTTPDLTLSNNSPVEPSLQVAQQVPLREEQKPVMPIETPKRTMPSIMELTSDTATSHPPHPALPYPLPLATNSPGPRFLDGLLFYASLPDGQPTHPPHHEPGIEKLSDPTNINISHPASAAPPQSTKTIYSTRNLVILEKFDPVKVQDRYSISKTLFPEEDRPVRKYKVPYEVCMMTSEVARFRDPSTGISYSNLWAYKQLQKVKGGHLQWSSLLGSFVGSLTPAKGVPDGFCD